jgi:dTDP-4-amino-4,6-dideoxygalactose transaminase
MRTIAVTTKSSLKLAAKNSPPADRPRVPFVDLAAGYREVQAELDSAYHRVAASGWYVLGEELEAFETEFAAYCGVSGCVGVGNGFDALFLILRAYGIGPGDEVLVPASTFIATWLAVEHTGARPVPVEIREDTFNLDPDRIEAAVTSRTKAIVAVHLYGQPADMDAVREVGVRHGLRLIEDAAQAHGAGYKGLRAGALSDAAAFSFYPVKNLGALGDGGAVVSSDPQLMKTVRRLRNYGALGKFDHEIAGFNSRLDPLQAAFLRVRLRHLERGNQRRRAVAEQYLEKLSAVPRCTLPAVPAWADPAWHLFVIRHPQRDRLRRYLESQGMETLIHYPRPPHLSPAFAELGFKRGDFPISERLAGAVLSLPIHPHLGPENVERVAQSVLDFEARGD